MRSQRLFLLTSALSALTLSACGTLGPNYERPDFGSSGDPLKAQSNRVAKEVDWRTWWKLFDDAALDRLLDEASAKNQDLVLAAGRIEEARATYLATDSSRFPTLDANATTSRSQVSENAGRLQPGGRSVNSTFLPGLYAAYEIDFWGKFRRADEAARARLLATEANRGAVLASLYSNVAQNYFALRALDAQHALAEQTYATRVENVRLQQIRFNGGVIGDLDLEQARAEAAAVEATLLQAKQNRNGVAAALATLLGRAPSGIVQPNIDRGTSLETLYARASVPHELPSDLLERRPDLIAAEQQLVAANADIGQAKAAYYPKLSLTASLGLESRDLSRLFDSGSIFWNLAAGLAQPIFRAGSIDAVVKGAEARKQQATAQYALAVQSAFKDVHDALNAIASSEALVVAANKRIAAAKEVRRLAELRNKHGYSSYLEVLTAERDLLQAESNAIDAKRAALIGTASLYKALGGGWDARAVAAVRMDNNKR